MLEVVITNKIEEKVDNYIQETGATKTFIATKAGMTKQALYTVIKSKNPTVEILHRLAYVLNCDIKDLYDIQIVNK